ncbi:hypothetical protein V8E36_009495 [Tilletia maclaganii]
MGEMDEIDKAQVKRRSRWPFVSFRGGLMVAVRGARTSSKGQPKSEDVFDSREAKREWERGNGSPCACLESAFVLLPGGIGGIRAEKDEQQGRPETFSTRASPSVRMLPSANSSTHKNRSGANSSSNAEEAARRRPYGPTTRTRCSSAYPVRARERLRTGGSSLTAMFIPQKRLSRAPKATKGASKADKDLHPIEHIVLHRAANLAGSGQLSRCALEGQV